MSSLKDKLLWLYKYGHAWNPVNQNLLNADEGRIKLMDGSEQDAEAMFASFQQLDGNVPELTGEADPDTADVMRMPRCAMPDHPPPPGAAFDYGDDDLNAAVASQQEFAQQVAGSGSWPQGCDPEFPGVHSVVTQIDISRASSSQKAIMTDVLRYVEETEAEVGQHVRHVISPATVSSPQHTVHYESIPGSVIGYAYFPQPNTCRQTVKARIDNGFNASLPVMAELLTHEYKGHSDGLQHTRGGIMNPSIGRPTKRASWIGDPSFSTKKRYFGGVPLTPTDPPEPKPNPPIGGTLFAEQVGSIIAIRGDLSLVIGTDTFTYLVAPIDGVPGQYRVVDKPRL